MIFLIFHLLSIILGLNTAIYTNSGEIIKKRRQIFKKYNKYYLIRDLWTIILLMMSLTIHKLQYIIIPIFIAVLINVFR